MRIKSIRLTNYKRFTSLHIHKIPETARLVVLIGPNGSGKSSLFDAFLNKAHGNKGNFRLEGERGGYYIKDEAEADLPNSTYEVWNRIKIEMHSSEPEENAWKQIFNVRSAYRNESDFQVDGIERTAPRVDTVRFHKIIDADQSVSDNYRRLAWKRMADLDTSAPGNQTFGSYRKESLGKLQRAMKKLFPDPRLELGDFGGTTGAGAFRFNKGNSFNFLYKNLSGGEKAAFDILLDAFVSKEEFKDSIYCIDEPEAHMAMALHGPLLQAILDILPKESQLWIATHSSGFVRRAYEIMQDTKDVAFLDFSDKDFDKAAEMTPCTSNREFWGRVYSIALDDLSMLIAPKYIVICEGNLLKADNGFDAKCYNKIFSDTHPDTLFIGNGGSNEVERSENIMVILNAVAKAIKIRRLIDRDDMTDAARKEKIRSGINVLERREIESYLYDPKVLRTFLRDISKEDYADNIIEKREELLQGSSKSPDVKSITQSLFGFIRKTVRHGTLGRDRVEFAEEFLVPALKNTPDVFCELEADIFTGKE